MKEVDLVALGNEEENDPTSLPSAGSFDVFLSHSVKDHQIVRGAFRLFTRHAGLRVYVDWMVDPKCERNDHSDENAALVRQRMRESKCLVFLQTRNTSRSKWIPWELGFFDGHKGKVAIFATDEAKYSKLSYIKLYPKIKVNEINGAYDFSIFRQKNKLGSLSEWGLAP